jgi:2-iminobutanoate/2-iminopropanoate deaminase
MRLALTIAGFVAVALPAFAQAQARTQVVGEGQSASVTLSPGIKVGNLVFSSGQLGMSRDKPDSTIGGQTKAALENVQKVFVAAGTSMANAAKCTVFLVELKDFSGMNAAYKEFFPKEPPARSTVVVAALVQPGAKIEIECIAAIPAK